MSGWFASSPYRVAMAAPMPASALAHNHGMIASFSRALLDELRSSMSDAALNAALAQAIDEIYTASTAKVWPVSPRPAVTAAKPFRCARRSRVSVGQGHAPCHPDVCRTSD